jgi:hypothetical protein
VRVDEGWWGLRGGWRGSKLADASGQRLAPLSSSVPIASARANPRIPSAMVC